MAGYGRSEPDEVTITAATRSRWKPAKLPFESSEPAGGTPCDAANCKASFGILNFDVFS